MLSISHKIQNAQKERGSFKKKSVRVILVLTAFLYSVCEGFVCAPPCAEVRAPEEKSPEQTPWQQLHDHYRTKATHQKD